MFKQLVFPPWFVYVQTVGWLLIYYVSNFSDQIESIPLIMI